MSFQHKLDSLLNKGKAKLKEYTDGKPTGQPQQGYPQYPQQHPQQSPPQQYPPQQYQQQPYYNNGPPPPPQQYQQYPGYQNPSPGPPPVPTWNKPQSPEVQSPYAQPPIPNAATRPHNPPSNTQPYWQPNFDPSIPINHVFIQETGAHGWGNNESQNYTTNPENCFFTPDHSLVLRGIVNSNSHDRYTSARLISEQRLSRQRGYLSVKIRAPSATGIWPAFWLLPAEPFTWPDDGEVDIFESWNGEGMNHSCLHWGHFNGEDWNKHRVVDTPIPDLRDREVQVGFAWDQEQDVNGARGRMVWYVDGRAVMKAPIPEGTRRMSDWRVIINVAMGGNVCQGKLPADGTYDFVLRELGTWDAPAGGWEQFGRDFEGTKEGRTM
ncbi:glycoside hydrolase family 16 protein [Halenospora varia]|nr:glycoside hydrolase family 16 protein [Halenospora varia]